MLSTIDHDRDAAGLTYVYPVLSRRSGGLSIGINLNPNNACNWRCIYCQVPDLNRGSAPKIDLDLLKSELDQFLASVIDGSFYADHSVPKNLQSIKDIAFSGNGEPTTAIELPEVMQIIEDARVQFNFSNQTKTVLITNGSMMQKQYVQSALQKMAALNGEVWFKIDSVLPDTILNINNVSISIAAIHKRLLKSAHLCPTLIQTCLFKRHGQLPDQNETSAYLAFLDRIVAEKIPIAGIHLYSLARPSLQPEAVNISPADPDWLSEFKSDIESKGIAVTVSI